ncbi:MAG: neutral/alkaline non-lysosomal ceramidase N-terminal domain-containing protein [Phycisphaerales bacterium]|nr:MAG: neutral/alkaline non-lysosomal ceramidase N-terminal domain-containing protein [Phycisphaerales bacterium]
MREVLGRSLNQIGSIIVIIFALVVLIPLQSNQAKGALCAGAARTDITPEKPIKMAGYASRTQLSEGVHDPLLARVVVFENDGKRLVLVSTDLIGFYGGTADHFRKIILEEFDLEPGELFLSSVHTHAGPGLTIDKEKGHVNNLEYTKKLEGTLVKLIDEAFDDMGAVRVGSGVGYSPVGMNRRELRFDSSGNSQIRLGRNPYGPTDKEVLVTKLARPDGEVFAVLFDYATHGTCLGGKNLTVSGDVMGLAGQFAEKILGEDVIVAGFAGASGNIDPWFRVLPAINTEPGWIPEPVLLGTLLGEEIVHVFRDIDEVSAGGRIGSGFIALELPGKPRSEDRIEKNQPPTVLNITVARIGDIGFVGLGAEVLTEIGMSIKAASPCKHTLVITHCNGAASYIAPEHLHIEGGYEIRSSPFAPQAAEMAVKQAVKMLHEI